jgi:Pin2-interacting protein X1
MEEIILKDTLNAHWKSNKSNFGFRMLQKMGWNEEKGLGKEGNGITKFVKISKRDDGMGLGMDQFKDDNVGSKAWSSTISSYNSVLEVLKATYKSSDSLNNMVNNNSTESSDNESSEETKSKKKKSKKEKRQKEKEEESEEEVKSPVIKSVGIK